MYLISDSSNSFILWPVPFFQESSFRTAISEVIRQRSFATWCLISTTFFFTWKYFGLGYLSEVSRYCIACCICNAHLPAHVRLGLPSTHCLVQVVQMWWHQGDSIPQRCLEGQDGSKRKPQSKTDSKRFYENPHFTWLFLVLFYARNEVTPINRNDISVYNLHSVDVR